MTISCVLQTHKQALKLTVPLGQSHRGGGAEQQQDCKAGSRHRSYSISLSLPTDYFVRSMQMLTAFSMMNLDLKQSLYMNYAAQRMQPHRASSLIG